MLFIGDRGMLLSDYGKHILLPEKEFKDYQAPEPWIAPSIGHHAEWLHACKNRRADHLPLWLLRAAHRGQPLGQRRLSRREKRSSGTRKNMRIPNAPDAERFLETRLPKRLEPGLNRGRLAKR